MDGPTVHPKPTGFKGFLSDSRDTILVGGYYLLVFALGLSVVLNNGNIDRSVAVM